MDPFSQKLFLKIFEHHKSHFFKNTKGSRFGLLRFGSVLKSKHRFGRFEVRFPEVWEVQGSVISGSFQVYSSMTELCSGQSCEAFPSITVILEKT